jgi:hypothetical protein
MIDNDLRNENSEKISKSEELNSSNIDANVEVMDENVMSIKQWRRSSVILTESLNEIYFKIDSEDTPPAVDFQITGLLTIISYIIILYFMFRKNDSNYLFATISPVAFVLDYILINIISGFLTEIKINEGTMVMGDKKCVIYNPSIVNVFPIISGNLVFLILMITLSKDYSSVAKVILYIRLSLSFSIFIYLLVSISIGSKNIVSKVQDYLTLNQSNDISRRSSFNDLVKTLLYVFYLLSSFTIVKDVFISYIFGLVLTISFKNDELVKQIFGYFITEGTSFQRPLNILNLSIILMDTVLLLSFMFLLDDNTIIGISLFVITRLITDLMILKRVFEKMENTRLVKLNHDNIT